LTGIDVACPFHPETTVFFVPAMHAIAANKPVKARSNRFGGTTGFNEYPYLDHVSSFSVVRWGLKAGGDDHAVMIFVEYESVQKEPPRVSIKATMAIRRRKPKAASGPWKRG
jgi:hypothetical protein